MKNRGLKIGSIGAVILLLLVSMNSVFAITSEHQNKIDSISSQTIDEEANSDTPYIDPNIYLTRKHLPILQRSLAQMDDNPNKELVQNIISCLEEQGSVTSKDVQRIIEETNVALAGVHFNKFLFGDGPGGAGCIPFTFLKSQYALFFLLLPAFLPTLFMIWDVEYNQPDGCHAPPGYNTAVVISGLLANYKYNQHTHTGGIAFGYLGLAGAYFGGSLIDNLWTKFFFGGYALLILVN